MALLPTFRKGRALKAGELASVRNAARAGANPTSTTGLDVIATPQGLSFAPQPTGEQIDNAVHAKYTTALAGLIYGVVEIYNTVETYTGPTIASCRIPSQSGFGWLGILLSQPEAYDAALDTAPAPWVQVRGISTIQYAGTVAVGDRLGGLKDSFYAQPDQGGPFTVLQLPEDGIAIVEITGRRLDAKLVDCDAENPDASGPYHTIIYKGRTVAEDSPGKLTTS